MVVVVVAAELIFKLRDYILVEIFTYKLKTLNNLLYGFFYQLYIYIYIYENSGNLKQYATARQHRPISKHSIPIDQLNRGPKKVFITFVPSP